MAGLADPGLRLAQPSGWFDQLAALVSQELAPTSRKVRTALRITLIGTIGAALVAICHVNNELGTYIVWLLAGAGPMTSMRKAITFLFAEALAIVGSVVMARAFAETPWLMLPFIFGLISYSTYVGTTRKLGTILLLIQVVSLNTIYGVVFAPNEIGWDAAGAFGGTVIAFCVIVLFDNWLWPDPSEAILMKALGAGVARERSRLLAAANYYLDREDAPRPPNPPPTSELPAFMTLLDQAAAEDVPEHRLAILLAAVTRVVRIGNELDRFTLLARQNVPGQIRALARPQIQAVVDAIAEVLSELAGELPNFIAVGVDQPPPVIRTRVRLAMDALATRVLQVRPTYIGKASTPEIENFASFNDSLAALTGHVERLLDEPPQPPAAATSNKLVPRLSDAPDPAVFRYAVKTGLCAVVAYVLGLLTQRADLSTILITVLITALPTYGAALRKMVLRIIGALIGGAVSLLAIIIVTPNFETLPAYMLAVFVVFYISAYAALSSGRVAYAGKQIGTTFAIVFSSLSPPLDVYEPLWRMWGILLGTFIVAIVVFGLWPEYAGDSLLPRLRRVIRDTLGLTPGGLAASSEARIQRANADIMSVLAQILEVANDARVEGRTSLVNHGAIVEAASSLRRIANRLSTIAMGRLVATTPQLDPATESAREAVLAAIGRQLQSWLDFFSGDKSLNRAAAEAIARTNSADELGQPLEQFKSRLEERTFARLESWTLEQRRTILAELESMHRLQLLVADLNRWLAQIPGPASNQ